MLRCAYYFAFLAICSRLYCAGRTFLSPIFVKFGYAINSGEMDTSLFTVPGPDISFGKKEKRCTIPPPHLM